MATRVHSFSKINLGLAIGPVREDGFHALTTMYQTLALCDVVTVTARLGEATRIGLTTNHRYVPTDERNTAWKMVAVCLARLGVAAEVAIHIEKNLPVQGGLGAGSANAAAALLGLERELGVALPEAERLALAAAVGSDVPLFLVGGAVLGTGRGEVVSPLMDLAAIPCVVAVPEVGVSTPAAFRDWDRLVAEGRSLANAHETPPFPMELERMGHPEQGNAHSPLEPERMGHPASNIPPFLTVPERIGYLAGGVGERSFAAANDTPPCDDETAARMGHPTGLNSRGGMGHPAGLSSTGGMERLAGLTAETKGDNLKKLSLAYAAWSARTSVVEPGTSGITHSDLPGLETSRDLGNQQGSFDLDQNGTMDDLAENTLLALVRTGIGNGLQNDFEEVVFPQYPSLRETKRLLMGSDSGSPAVYAALSGSGSALFGLYRSMADARAAQQRVQASGTRAWLTTTLPRSDYWRRMFAG